MKLAKLEEIEKVNSDLEFDPLPRDTPISFDKVLSTGSTLLDLNISGERIRGGGLPAGIFMEVYGPESIGKTAVISEIMASAQKKKPPGVVDVNDPEGRFSEEHARIYDMAFPEENYNRPDTVTELFELFDVFHLSVTGGVQDDEEDEDKSSRKKKKRKKKKRSDTRVVKLYDPSKLGISVFGVDSLAALSTKMEMEDEDKMGMRRAKEFSQGLRKYTRRIHNSNLILAASNQVRDSDSGVTTPGGRAIRFYADLRLQMKWGYPEKWIKRTRTLDSKKKVTQTVGQIAEVKVQKSSVGMPFRECPVYIEFGYGVDDIRANLQWYKDLTGNSRYGIDKASSAQSMDDAVYKIEGSPDDNGEPTKDPRDLDLREEVIDLWLEVQEELKETRARKRR